MNVNDVDTNGLQEILMTHYQQYVLNVKVDYGMNRWTMYKMSLDIQLYNYTTIQLYNYTTIQLYKIGNPTWTFAITQGVLVGC